MHAPALKKYTHLSPDIVEKYVHFLPDTFHRVGPHILLMTFIVLAFAFILSQLNLPSDYTSPSLSQEYGALSLHPVNLQTDALTVFDDPHYTHEYGARTRFLREQLVTLTETSHAARVSVVVYGSGDSALADVNHTKTFEVSWEDSAPTFEVLQGYRQRDWSYMQDANAQHYGLDIMNEKAVSSGILELNMPENLLPFRMMNLMYSDRRHRMSEPDCWTLSKL